VVSEFAKKQGVSKSMIVRDLIKEALELREDLALAEFAEMRETTHIRCDKGYGPQGGMGLAWPILSNIIHLLKMRTFPNRTKQTLQESGERSRRDFLLHRKTMESPCDGR
jgi:hypothetical protein